MSFPLTSPAFPGTPLTPCPLNTLISAAHLRPGVQFGMWCCSKCVLVHRRKTWTRSASTDRGSQGTNVRALSSLAGALLRRAFTQHGAPQRKRGHACGFPRAARDSSEPLKCTGVWKERQQVPNSSDLGASHGSWSRALKPGLESHPWHNPTLDGSCLSPL